MAYTLNIDLDDISNLYMTYHELLTLKLNQDDPSKVDTSNVHEYFGKLYKYYTGLCNVYKSYAVSIPAKADDLNETIQELQSEFDEILNKANEIFGENEKIGKDFLNIDNLEPDNIEKLLIGADSSAVYKKISHELKKMGAKTSSINFLKKYIKINPDKYRGCIIIAAHYTQKGEFRKAISYLEHHNQYCATNPKVYVKLGLLYSFLDRYDYFEERVSNFQKALELDPKNEEALRYLAITCRNAGENQKSVDYYEKLMEINPSRGDYFSYGCEKLKFGDFETGLKYWHYRFSKEYNPASYPDITKPQWDYANTDLSDKTLFIQSEQGYGDSIQFLRYVPMIKAKKIILRVPECLRELFELNLQGFKHIEITGKAFSAEEAEFDYHLPFCSVMNVFNTRIDNIPNSEGYISANETKIKIYKEGFFNNDLLKIGIAWKGKHNGDNYRDIPLEVFHPLTLIKNARVYSLQKNGEEEFQESILSGFDIRDLGSTFENFSDTAAAIANLDVVITGDNVVANLVGAMGKKTILLVQKDADWRWFLDREDSPWYKSFTIIRKDYQKQPWDVLMAKAIELLNI